MPLFQRESNRETISSYYENDFDLHEKETTCRTHFQGFVLRLVLKQRHKRTRKWRIIFNYFRVANRRTAFAVIERW